MAARKGTKPWNWKGEPVIDPRGYVLIFVGKDHPLADCRGYAYEHRLKAEAKLGRPLRGKEEVHHDDENKSNNDPGNLIVAKDGREHRFLHRRPGSRLQRPDEDNSIVNCKCGCGAEFLKFDACGRPRDYVSGHNPQQDTTLKAILASLAGGALTVSKIAPHLSDGAVQVALTRLRKAGKVRRIDRGIWELGRDLNPTIGNTRRFPHRKVSL